MESELRTRAMASVPVTASVNGRKWSGDIPADETLLQFLRTRLGLRGTKRSCESQVCGACTVLIDGGPVSSCSYLAFEIDGRVVTTVEGLGCPEGLGPLQQAFVEAGAQQCGYCTGGQLMAAQGLLNEHAAPKREEIRRWMAGNICRCGCYPAIIEAVERAIEAQGGRDGS